MRMLLATYAVGPFHSSIVMNLLIPSVYGGTENFGTNQFIPKLPIGRGTHVFKTHSLPSATQPFDCAVYIKRNQKDVLCSMAHYLVTVNGGTAAEHARRFIRNGGDLGLPDICPFFSHEPAWAALGDKVLVVDYERLRLAPIDELERVVTWLGEPKDDLRIIKAVQACRFSTLRAMEAKEKRQGVTALPGRDVSFFRSGGSDYSLDDIEPGLDAAFDEAFGRVLA